MNARLRRARVSAFAQPVVLATASCGAGRLATPPHLAFGAHYVAMGSSFAAGPGITTAAESSRCERSADNYAHLLARARNLRLTHVSCGGATTANVLGPWNELPAQLDALRPDTKLVTVTIGGNDVNYIGGLAEAACRNLADDARPPSCQARLSRAASGGPPVDEARWQGVAVAMDRIAAEVARRSPGARLIFVDYLEILPLDQLCRNTPLSPADADASRATAARLVDVTAAAAARAGAGLIRASALSRGHDACAAKPWTTGFEPPPGPRRGAPFHPTLAGMKAIAAALEAAVSQER